jgi:hypothetical protein
MDPVERLASDKPLKGFDAEGVLAEGKGTLVAEASLSEPGEVLGCGVFGSADNVQELSAPNLDARLGKAPLTSMNCLGGLDDCVFLRRRRR